MSAPTDPRNKDADAIPFQELLAHLAGEGRILDARRLAVLLMELRGYEIADRVWRDFYGRGLFDED